MDPEQNAWGEVNGGKVSRGPGMGNNVGRFGEFKEDHIGPSSAIHARYEVMNERCRLRLVRMVLAKLIDLLEFHVTKQLQV